MNSRFTDPVSHKIDYTAYGLHRNHPQAWGFNTFFEHFGQLSTVDKNLDIFLQMIWAIPSPRHNGGIGTGLTWPWRPAKLVLISSKKLRYQSKILIWAFVERLQKTQLNVILGSSKGCTVSSKISSAQSEPCNSG